MRFNLVAVLLSTVLVSGNTLAQEKTKWKFYAIKIYEKQSGCNVKLAKTYSTIWINMSKDHRKVQAQINEAAQAKHPNNWWEFSAYEGYVAIVKRTVKCQKGATGTTYTFYQAGTEQKVKEKIEEDNKNYLNTTIVQLIDISEATRDLDATQSYIKGD